MSDENFDRNDEIRHRNMVRIGEQCGPLPRADQDRQARWQQATLNNDTHTPHEGVTRMKRRKHVAFITSGALAAAAALAVWFVTAGTPRVSAAAILDHLKQALGRKMTIDIKNIDLDDVAVNGQIVLDRKGEWLNEATDSLYAELHVKMKPDSPDWGDFDAALVVCQTPQTAWTYCRGNGGFNSSLFGPHRVTPTDYLVKGHSWREFVENPLDRFGAMPAALGFGSLGSHVQYRFPPVQREFVQQLLYFVLKDLGSADSASQVLDQLDRTAGDITIEKSDENTWVLHATNLKQIGNLRIPKLPDLPDMKEALKDDIVKLNYSSTCRCILSVYWNTPKALRDLGVSVEGHDEPQGTWKNVDALVDELNASYDVVSTKQTSNTEWEIQVKGLPAQLDMSERDWSRNVLPTLLNNLELRVYYDAATEEVLRAEFSGIGTDGGSITLQMDTAELAPDQLKWDGWINNHTVQLNEPDLAAPTDGEDPSTEADQAAAG